MKYLSITGLLLLMACASPQQTCLNDAGKDLRVIDQLIAESRENLRRGYALEREYVPTLRLVPCRYPTHHGHFCNMRTTRVVEKPVAIDPAAEREKLRTLEQQRGEQLTRAQNARNACLRQYPEG